MSHQIYYRKRYGQGANINPIITALEISKLERIIIKYLNKTTH